MRTGARIVGLWVAFALSGAAPAPAQQTTGTPGSPGATTSIDGRYLPPPPQEFKGDIQANADASTPDWPALVAPPKGAPNILLIMTDDVGFSAPSTSAESSPRRRWIAWRPWVSAIRGSTPRRSARRPGLRC